MRLMALALAATASMTVAAVTCEAQEAVATPPRYEASFYTTAPNPKQVTITDKSGRVLSVLEVPADVAVSLHLISGESNVPGELAGEVRFAGDVSIRTLPRSELVQGSLLAQMMKGALRLDVHDVVVVLTAKR